MNVLAKSLRPMRRPGGSKSISRYPCHCGKLCWRIRLMVSEEAALQLAAWAITGPGFAFLVICLFCSFLKGLLGMIFIYFIGFLSKSK